MLPDTPELRQRPFIEFLLSWRSYGDSPVDVDHLETHISHIFLVGEFAYKLKKAVKLSFLDFSDDHKRSDFVERELVLNRRYAAPLYLETRELSLKDGNVAWGTNGEQSERVLKMRRFKQQDLFSNLVSQNRVSPELLQRLVSKIVRFHIEAEPRPNSFVPEFFEKLVNDCLALIPKELLSREFNSALTHTLHKLRKEITRRQPSHVRLVHGDLHLGNICLYQNEPFPFDGIEFDEKYAAIDTMADFAFLLMDLWRLNQSHLAWSALNIYLEQSFDYEGVVLLPLFLSYRALVRSKVLSIALKQHDHPQNTPELLEYISLAQSALTPNFPALTVIGGLSGSGKTFLGRLLSEQFGALHLRSDVFRKHLAKTPLDQELPIEWYSHEHSEETYRELYSTAKNLLLQGLPVVIDAVHGTTQDRALCEDLASHCHSVTKLWCSVPDHIACARIAQRTKDASDATLEVFQSQKASLSPPDTPGWRFIKMDQNAEALVKILKEFTLQAPWPREARREKKSSSRIREKE